MKGKNEDKKDTKTNVEKGDEVKCSTRAKQGPPKRSKVKKAKEKKPELTNEARIRESKMIYLRNFNPQEYERLMKSEQENNRLVSTNENRNLN